MILVILPVTVFIIIFIAMLVTDYGFDEAFTSAGVASIFALLVSILIIIISSAVPGKTKLYNTETIKLTALKDNLGIQGHYFLGSGNIDSEMQYVYMYQTDDNGYKVNSIKATKATIYYLTDAENTTPYLEIATFGFSNKLRTFLFRHNYYSEYKFYIPNGSIINNYIIDLH